MVVVVVSAVIVRDSGVCIYLKSDDSLSSTILLFVNSTLFVMAEQRAMRKHGDEKNAWQNMPNNGMDDSNVFAKTAEWLRWELVRFDRDAVFTAARLQQAVVIPLIAQSRTAYIVCSPNCVQWKAFATIPRISGESLSSNVSQFKQENSEINENKTIQRRPRHDATISWTNVCSR